MEEAKRKKFKKLSYIIILIGIIMLLFSLFYVGVPAAKENQKFVHPVWKGGLYIEPNETHHEVIRGGVEISFCSYMVLANDTIPDSYIRFTFDSIDNYVNFNNSIYSDGSYGGSINPNITYNNPLFSASKDLYIETNSDYTIVLFGSWSNDTLKTFLWHAFSILLVISMCLIIIPCLFLERLSRKETPPPSP